MRITILTLFPEMFDGFLTNSIIKRAVGTEAVSFEIVNIRNFTNDKYGRVDTPPIGGGSGLVLKMQPLVDAINMHSRENTKKLLLSPRGKTFDQKQACLLSKESHILLVCGHYEGIDARIENYIDESISIGDYILTGGEIAAMAIADSITRLIDGVISKESLSTESFNNDLLEYSQYTEPYDFEGHKVPDILYSGNHKAINKYRLKESLKLTMKYRPDLFKNHTLSKEEEKLIDELNCIEKPLWEKEAIEKGYKFIKK